MTPLLTCLPPVLFVLSLISDETSLTNQEKNWNEYVAKANDLEARIELVKIDKTLVNGWGVYFTELMHKHRANTPPGTDRAKSARTTRNTTRS
jgi:hypothetical protein